MRTALYRVHGYVECDVCPCELCVGEVVCVMCRHVCCVCVERGLHDVCGMHTHGGRCTWRICVYMCGECCGLCVWCMNGICVEYMHVWGVRLCGECVCS